MYQNNPTEETLEERRDKYTWKDINNSGYGLPISYSGTLGSAWFTARRDENASEADIEDETKRALEYTEEIRNNKINIINNHDLKIDRVFNNKVYLVNYDDDKRVKYTYTFIIYPREWAHLKKHTDLDIEAFIAKQS